MYFVYEMYFCSDSTGIGFDGWPIKFVNEPWHVEQEHVKGVMQFSGVHDANGAEIYTGDICQLKAGEEPINFEVDFEDGCFVARVPWKKENSPELKCYCYFKPEIMTVEVIGNIYENPELR